MREKITVFYSKKTTAKTPLSPFDDNTFIFETFEATSNLQAFSVLVSHFVLNLPLSKLKKATRTFRRKTNLEQFYNKEVTYLLLDIDDVKSEFDKQRVIDCFKDFKVIPGESKSYNGIDNFNMKGILFTENIDFDYIKNAISSINHDLKELCTIDESVTRKATLNAPINKSNVLYNNEDGIRFKHVKKEIFEQTEDIKKEYFGETTHINIDDLKDIEADTMEKLCLKIFQMIGYKAIKNNANGSISFTHPSEKKTLGGYFWFSSSPYTMHHGNSTKTVNIFDSVRKLDVAKKLMHKEINYDTEFLEYNTDTSVLSINEKFIKVDEKVKTKIDSFLSGKNGLLSIKSPMGTGKSSIIKHLIEECHDQDMKVLIITNRVSVANDFGKKYNIKIYNKDKYELGDSLVCQYDSLWKFNIKFFDIVVMDEFISLMLHSRSNLNNSSVNIAKFFGCFNKKLVIADAFLTGYENFLLSNKESNLHMIDNHYRDPTTLYDYDNQNYFVQSILFHAKNQAKENKKHKITVSATSLNFINSLSMLLTNHGLNVVTLTADTPETTKKIIYTLFEENEHDKWDVLIYSPTLTVGVSNLNNTNYHFHYDSSISTDVISSLQMIKRTRKTKEIHMFIKEKINYLKTSYNEIRDEVMGNIGKNIEHNYLFDIDDYGEVRLSNIGKKAIKIDTFKNIMEFDHKKAMKWLLNFHFLYEPRTINNKFTGNVLQKYQKILKTNKNDLIEMNLNQYQELNDIDKTILLLDNQSDKNLRLIAEIDTEIKDCSNDIRANILRCAINDPSFMKKCRYYSVTINYTTKLWDDTTIKNLVSESVVKGENDDLDFYNHLLTFGQYEILDEYVPKTVNYNRKLKYIIEKCGYRLTQIKKPDVVGYRGFAVDENVKLYHSYIV